MNTALMPLVVRLQLAASDVRTKASNAWLHRHDEDGVDEAVTKMIWLAVGIVVALAATAFFTTKFNQAKDSVPNPVSP